VAGESQYWAFSEIVFRTATSIFAGFDLLPSESLSSLIRSEDRDGAFLDLRPSVLWVHAAGPDRDGLLRRTTGRLVESSWYSLHIGPEGIAGQMLASLEEPEAEPTHITALERLDGRSGDGRNLRRAHSLAEFWQVGPEKLIEALDESLKAARSVCVYDVGQGNANAVCDESNLPLLYFDLGGGCAWNARTYPVNQRKAFCWTCRPPVVLSHWDFDHYFSGTFLRDAWKTTWIVPEQGPIGPTPRKMLAQIRQQGGTVLVWSRPPWAAQCGRVSLERPSPASGSKNQSGIVLRVDLPCSGGSRGILLPGDAGYKHLPPRLTRDLAGLVATHHGASRHMGVPPSTVGAGAVVYSYGPHNTYGHPTKAAGDRHAANGWNARFDTPNGDVLIAPWFTSLLVPCGGAQCGIQLRQGVLP